MGERQKTRQRSTALRLLPVLIALVRELISLRTFMRLSQQERKSSLYRPRHFVQSLLRLGPTFIKLGQILSTRLDLIPAEYIEELKVLHESVPSFDFSDVERIVREELGKPVGEVFASFDRNPVAAASLAQVHLATLHDGTRVAVKVQRPAIREHMDRDLEILGLIARAFAVIFRKMAANLNLNEVFSEFKRYTLKELDFYQEAENLERFRSNFRDWHDVHFPAVFWDYTTSKILTMEAVSGLRLHQVAGVLGREERRTLNERIVELEMKMFISDGFFHADLHPGNIFFGEDGGITVIDVGMCGELTPELRDRFVLYWLPIVQREKKRAFHHITRVSKRTPNADEESYYRSFCRILDEFYKSDISSRSLTKTFLEILITGAKYGFRFPSELLLQAKALTTAEALAFVLFPDFKFSEDARPIIVKEVARRAAIEQIEQRLERTLPEWLFLGELPPKSALEKDDESFKELWKEVAKVWAKEFDDKPACGREVRHGEYAVEIEENIERVFNFVSRLAQYAHWHPTYTERSRVIHVDGEFVFLTPDVVGSVFQIDEIVDGVRVRSNGEITEFERNRLMKWRAPVSFFPALFIGTCFTLSAVDDNTTRLHEYFYYLDDPLVDFFLNRSMLGSNEALNFHIEEELRGVKAIIEGRRYDPQDMEFLWEHVTEVVRIFPEKTAYKAALGAL